MTALGRRSLAVAADVGDLAGIDRMVRDVIEAFGRIDVLVNNAGVTRRAYIMDLTEADWDRIMRVNGKGVFFCLQRVAREMIPRRRGVIVNIASIAGKGYAGTSNAIYAASKGAVISADAHRRAPARPAQHQRQRHLPGHDRHRAVQGQPGHPRARGGRQRRGDGRPAATRASRWAVPTTPRTWPPWRSSWPRRAPATSPGSPSTWTAASSSIEERRIHDATADPSRPAGARCHRPRPRAPRLTGLAPGPRLSVPRRGLVGHVGGVLPARRERPLLPDDQKVEGEKVIGKGEMVGRTQEFKIVGTLTGSKLTYGRTELTIDDRRMTGTSAFGGGLTITLVKEKSCRRSGSPCPSAASSSASPRSTRCWRWPPGPTRARSSTPSGSATAGRQAAPRLDRAAGRPRRRHAAPAPGRGLHGLVSRPRPPRVRLPVGHARPPVPGPDAAGGLHGTGGRRRQRARGSALGRGGPRAGRPARGEHRDLPAALG